jgi:uncharacterized protein (TIRG00374 family)
LKSRLARYINIALLLLGLGLLVVLLVRLDLEEVKDKLIQVGWYFIPAFAAYVLGLATTSLGWQYFIDPEASRARFRDLFAAFWAGHAVNISTPTGSLGEVLKGTLVRDKVKGDELVASLVTLNFLSTVVPLIFTVIGPLLCMLFLDLPMNVMLATLGVALALFIPVTVVFILLRLGVASVLVKILRKLPLVKFKDPEGLLEKARSIDRRIRECYSKRPARFVKGILWLFFVRLTQVAEVWFILLALLPDQGALWLLLLAVLTQTVSQLLIWVLTFIPGQVGVAEAGSALLFEFLHLDPLVGFSMELIRRIRKILGIAIGLLIGWLVGMRISKRDRASVIEQQQCELDSHSESKS